MSPKNLALLSTTKNRSMSCTRKSKKNSRSRKLIDWQKNRLKKVRDRITFLTISQTNTIEKINIEESHEEAELKKSS
jgi:hypothetical protein